MEEKMLELLQGFPGEFFLVMGGLAIMFLISKRRNKNGKML